MKPSFHKLAPATFLLLTLFSCTKKSSEEQIKPQSESIAQMKEPISINAGQYDFLVKNFSNVHIRDSFGLHLQDSVSRISGAKIAAAAATLPPEAWNPNLFEENSNYFYGTNPPEAIAIDYVDWAQYELRPRFDFPLRQNSMVISIRMKWAGSNNAMLNPNATYLGQPMPIITGPALGTVEGPINQILNINNFQYRVVGNCSADVIEKRTIAQTSDGKWLMKAGLDAPGLQIGAEVSQGVNIVVSYNNVSDFYYSVNYECDFMLNQNALNPRVNMTGRATCTGMQRN